MKEEKKTCEELRAERRKKYGLDDPTRINVLSFDACLLTHCDCGCNIRLGMSRKVFLKFIEVLNREDFSMVEIDETKSNFSIIRILDYIGAVNGNI